MAQYTLKKIKKQIDLKSIVLSLDVIRPKGFRFSGEMHDFWEAVCVTDGVATATGDDRIYRLCKGDILFHKPMEFHRVFASENSGVHLLIISFRADGDVMKNFENGFFKLTDFQIAEFSKLASLFADAITEFETCPKTKDYAEKSTAAAIAFEKFIFELCFAARIIPEPDTGYEKTYHQIVNFMQEHCHESLTTEIIAKNCNLSVSNLKRIFKMFCDKSVIEYHNSLRLRTAISLLQNGIGIAKASEMTGFSSPAYFHTCFKKETGLTPKEYLSKNFDM